MKRLTNLLLLASVLLAGAALAQSGALPDDARFDQPVEFSTSNGGEQLSTMVVALIGAFDKWLGLGLDPYETARLAYEIERIERKSGDYDWLSHYTFDE